MLTVPRQTTFKKSALLTLVDASCAPAGEKEKGVKCFLRVAPLVVEKRNIEMHNELCIKIFP